uniref:TLC domain-containing protein n=1 Tax=Brugia timori TaxID=42155 RepID=A0A0R3QL85_9BILA
LHMMREILGDIIRPTHYGLEWELPRISDVLETNFFLPILIYFIILQILGYLVKQLLWISYLQLTRHRLQNLTVSLVHSCIAGCSSLIFFITRPIVMLEDAIHWYNPVAAQLIYFSMAYFLYDTTDVIRNDSSWHAFVILAHHTVVYSIFSIGMLSHKFLPYTYWALMVEINTSFLHVRSIMRLTNRDPCKNLCYKTISLLAFLTFFVFRLGTLLWMMLFMVMNYGTFHPFYTYSSLTAEVFFFIFSIFLLRHLLIEEGILEKAVL